MSQAPLLPTLTLNRHFVEALIAQETPCCALGPVEEHGQPHAVLALRPGVAIPSGITDQGFKLGHALLGGAGVELIQFSFEFYGFGTYNLLLNPSNPLVRSVVGRMVDHGAYFILAIGPQLQVCAFRAAVGRHDLSGLCDNIRRLVRSTTTEAQYRDALEQFQRWSNPPGRLLRWVCRDQAAALDLTTDRLELSPAPASGPTPPDHSGPRALAAALDARVKVLAQSGISDMDLFAAMAEQLPLVMQIMKQAGRGELNALCAGYPAILSVCEGAGGGRLRHRRGRHPGARLRARQPGLCSPVWPRSLRAAVGAPSAAAPA